MRWHQQNTIGANYTDRDAASPRGICHGCALGSAHQYPTNQHYVLSDIPYDPGQQFVVDAFQHHSVGSHGLNKPTFSQTSLPGKCTWYSRRQNSSLKSRTEWHCFSMLTQNGSLMKPVGQSNIQLTCFSYRRNCDKTRLRCSLLNCDYTLQMLQQVATNDYNPNGRCITQTVKQGCASVRIVKQQTATFQTKGPRSVRLYATLTY